MRGPYGGSFKTTVPHAPFAICGRNFRARYLDFPLPPGLNLDVSKCAEKAKNHQTFAVNIRPAQLSSNSSRHTVFCETLHKKNLPLESAADRLVDEICRSNTAWTV